MHFYGICQVKHKRINPQKNLGATPKTFSSHKATMLHVIHEEEGTTLKTTTKDESALLQRSCWLNQT